MLKSHIAACLLTTALITAPALAQATNPAPNANQPPGRTQPNQGANQGQFLTQESPNQWRGSKLVGLTVYGPNNERIGDINEVLLNQNGKVDAVVIGVGGFLGIGEKDVAVPFNEVKFLDQAQAQDTRAGTVASPTAPANPNAPANTNTNMPGGTATTTRTDPGTAGRGYPDRAVVNMTKD